MSRLTLKEAISHAKEVAEENYRQGMLCHANPNDEELDKCIECGKEHEQLAGWLKELQRYKDLEEQGRLIELPCAVGDTVYWISESDACLFCNSLCYERCEEGALKIKEIPFKLHMLNEIGEIIFLTKEAAVAKLAEMEGAE